MSKLLDQIAAAPDRNEENLEIPEWGVTVKIVVPSMAERSKLISSFSGGLKDDDDRVTEDGLNTMQFETLRACVFDPADDTPVFDDPAAADVLASKNGQVVFDLFRICQVYAGLTGDADVDAAEVPTAQAMDEGKD